MTAQPPPPPQLYLVRHAESRWNRARRRLDLIGLLRGVDHALTPAGVRQCLSLRARILAARAPPEGLPEDEGESGHAAAVLDASTLRLSSPLTRAVMTAALTTRPLDSDGAAAAWPLRVVAQAREASAHPITGRDSIGTPPARIQSRMQSKLIKHWAGAGCHDEPLPPVPSLDLTGLDEVWWCVNEPAESVRPSVH